MFGAVLQEEVKQQLIPDKLALFEAQDEAHSIEQAQVDLAT